MRLPPPAELTEILNGLPAGWRVLSYQHSSMGWEARLQFKRRTFELISERGGMDVYEIIKGKHQQLRPLGDQPMFLKPAHVWQMLLAATGGAPRPKFAQFSLRLMLLVVALLAVAAAWYGVVSKHRLADAQSELGRLEIDREFFTPERPFMRTPKQIDAAIAKQKAILGDAAK